MNLGRVIGRIWATHKLKALTGRRMLLVESLSSSGEPLGTVQVALDTVDAGTGDVVMMATSGEAAIPFGPQLTPTDRTIVGVVDRIDGEKGSWQAA